MNRTLSSLSISICMSECFTKTKIGNNFELRKIQNHINYQSNFKYKNKTLINDIHILAYELLKRTVYNINIGKRLSFDSSDYLADDIYQLIIKKRIENFNNKII